MERSSTGIARDKTRALRPLANKTPIVMCGTLAYERKSRLATVKQPEQATKTPYVANFGSA
jgi:hypothetical protein